MKMVNVYTLKHRGQTQFRVNDDQEVGQLEAEYDPELGQSDLMFWVKSAES